uniref:Cytochrome b-c1 complex subunit Rieske, mitochondrial n=1 Tax=Dunaliella tertiolecta TaxID=3047 RepID=A0A7S3QT69_DUNTE|mmetsp:Transcript_505/g.1310  ORF Transcript_505/g.1310 Transcript_505/m.1310 type:complete len:265 (+) Transcript_505:131-925(+)
MRQATLNIARRLLAPSACTSNVCPAAGPMALQGLQMYEQQQLSTSRGFAAGPPSSTPTELSKPSTAGTLSPLSKLSLAPSNKITYNELNHARFEPGTEGRPLAYFVQTGGRFLYASAIRLAVLKAVVSLSAAADTLAMSSLEVDLSGIEEGQTITVKWRGKPVFIKHRTEEDIAAANNVNLGGLRDPQPDSERAVDPKYLIVVGVCTHLGCVPIAGAGNYQGWFCPCHGSHYDGSGRTREGPAPYNLEVPEYRFLEDGQKVMIG